jgi:hypothetical protein
MQPMPFLNPFETRRRPETEIEVIVGRARRAELARKEQRKAERSAQRRARVARVFGR